MADIPLLRFLRVERRHSLGLSISHDIIVKQHGGSIEVETQPGEFTEIRVILPFRVSNGSRSTPAIRALFIKTSRWP
jgi:signal transduction histidine kinase